MRRLFAVLIVVAATLACVAGALIANGQFLEMKFRQPDFLAR